jgi:hypothetical protein
MRPSPSTRLYLGAAHLVARAIAAPVVRSVYVRRSVAAGDARFPQSDLDLGVIVDPCSGATLWSLYERYRRARLLFPRLGECQITTREELHDLAHADPYRASLDRRAALHVRGEPADIPRGPLEPRAVARRLVFWLEHYVPWSVRQERRRDQHKFLLEMWNALGVLTGRWSEPLISRRDVRRTLDAAASAERAAPFVQCLRIAEAAHGLLQPLSARSTPRLDAPVVVDAARPIVLLPSADSPWPAAAWQPRAVVVTPPALDLLISTQTPFWWLEAGDALDALGFAPPDRATWIAACLRQAGGERLRNPGFSESGPGSEAQRLARVRSVVEWLEAPATTSLPSIRALTSAPRTLREHYVGQYDALAAEAAALRARVRRLVDSRDDGATAFALA